MRGPFLMTSCFFCENGSSRALISRLRSRTTHDVGFEMMHVLLLETLEMFSANSGGQDAALPATQRLSPPVYEPLGENRKQDITELVHVQSCDQISGQSC